MLKKKNLGQYSKNYRTFYSKNCHLALKNMGLGSGIWDPEKTYSVVKKYLYKCFAIFQWISGIAGACPPCPQTVRVSCYCGQSSPTVKRCSAAAWACGKTCGRRLACGIHACALACHPGDCAPCAKTSIQSCACKRTKVHIFCFSPVL
jgi:hypothetical protein